MQKENPPQPPVHHFGVHNDQDPSSTTMLYRHPMEEIASQLKHHHLTPPEKEAMSKASSKVLRSIALGTFGGIVTAYLIAKNHRPSAIGGLFLYTGGTLLGIQIGAYYGVRRGMDVLNHSLPPDSKLLKLMKSAREGKRFETFVPATTPTVQTAAAKESPTPTTAGKNNESVSSNSWEAIRNHQVPSSHSSSTDKTVQAGKFGEEKKKAVHYNKYGDVIED